MDAYLEDLFAKRQHAWSRQQEILNRAVEEGRENTPEEHRELDRTDGAIDAYLADERKHIARLDAIKGADAMRAAMAPKIEKAVDRRQSGSATDLEFRNFVFASAKELSGSAARTWDGPNVSTDFAVAWNRANNALRTTGEIRALQSEGGSAVPTEFVEQVVIYERTMVPMLSVANVLNTPSGAAIVLPRLTADPSQASTLVAEAGGITEADPTISSVTLNAYKYAGTTLWSRELDQDNVIGLEDLIAFSAARQIAISGIGAALTTGDGSSKPNGVVTAAANGGTANGTASGGQATDTFFSALDLIDLFYGRAAPYRDVGTWMVSTTALAKMRKFRDANGAFLWVDARPGSLPSFLGRPVVENPAMASVASVSKSVLFGDFGRYFVRRLPIRVESSIHYKFSTDQLALRTIERVDGDLIDGAAIAYLISANT